MSNLLEQAKIAAQQEEWSLLIQCLQQMEAEIGSSQSPFHPASADYQQILALALRVLEVGDFQERWEIAKVFPKLGTAAIAPLITLLEDEATDLEQRWFAVRILGEFDCPEAIATLAELLETSDNDDLCSMAAHTLANLGPKAIKALTQQLQLEESREFAVRAIAQIRHPEIVEPLLRVVNDPNATIRATALSALSSFHDSRIPPILVTALQDPAAAVRKEAAIALGLRTYLDRELDLVSLLKPLLSDLRFDVCVAATIALGRVKTDVAARTLSEGLQSDLTPTPLKIEIVRALGWMETAVALDSLQQALRANLSAPASHSISLIQEIVALLGRVENPTLKAKATEILLELLQSQSSDLVQQVKPTLAAALGQLQDRRSLEPLILLLADEDEALRFHCIAALKQLAPQEARQQLKQLYEQGDIQPTLKQGVAIALQEWS